MSLSDIVLFQEVDMNIFIMLLPLQELTSFDNEGQSMPQLVVKYETCEKCVSSG